MKESNVISVHDLPKSILKYLRLGTCSWNYQEWSDIGIYSKKVQKHYEYLPEYSEYFNTVEIDQWFWSLIDKNTIRLPKKSDVKAYNDLTPEDFKFTVKAPNSLTLTHFYKSSDQNPDFFNPKLFDSFIKNISSLNKKLGPVMFEFEYLNKDKMSSLSEFLDKFGKFSEYFPKEYEFAIETRNPNYLKKEYFEFLKLKKIGCVLIDGYYMPPIEKVFSDFGDYILGSPVVIRLLGKDRAGIEKKTGKVWTAIVENRDETIEKTINIILNLLKKKVAVFSNINNHFEGSAPLTIGKIINILKK